MANRYAAEYGVMYGRPVIKGSVTIKRERAKALGLAQSGKLFKLNWATRSLTIVLRSVKVVWPGRQGRHRHSHGRGASRAIWPTLYIQPAAPKPKNFIVKVPEIVNSRILLLPSALKTASDLQIAVLAQRPSPVVTGFRIFVSDSNTAYDYDSTQDSMLFPASYLLIATIEGNFVTPYVMGRSLTLNPVIILLSLTFWGWMWGIAGVILAVPILAAFKIFCAHIEEMEPIAEFLS